uniref:Uncharacterized protein n=1 Tax=Meloidogyne javanica TaxID=6303 RepID=A0A915LXR5_MELJA
MDSNSDNLTQENMSNDTSLASIESGFVSLNGLGTKEQMAVEIDLIPKMEKDKDVNIFARIGKVANFFKELVEKTACRAKNMTCDTSLTSLESGFVSLNGLETNEQMAVEIDLIPNKIVEKKKDSKIFVKPGKVTNSFKELDKKTNDNVKV